MKQMTCPINLEIGNYIEYMFVNTKFLVCCVSVQLSLDGIYNNSMMCIGSGPPLFYLQTKLLKAVVVQQQQRQLQRIALIVIITNESRVLLHHGYAACAVKLSELKSCSLQHPTSKTNNN